MLKFNDFVLLFVIHSFTFTFMHIFESLSLPFHVGLAHMLLLILGFGAFVPSYYKYLTSGNWYFDAVFEADWPRTLLASGKYGSAWHLLVSSHANFIISDRPISR